MARGMQAQLFDLRAAARAQEMVQERLAAEHDRGCHSNCHAASHRPAIDPGHLHVRGRLAEGIGKVNVKLDSIRDFVTTPPGERRSFPGIIHQAKAVQVSDGEADALFTARNAPDPVLSPASIATHLCSHF